MNPDKFNNSVPNRISKQNSGPSCVAECSRKEQDYSAGSNSKTSNAVTLTCNVSNLCKVHPNDPQSLTWQAKVKTAHLQQYHSEKQPHAECQLRRNICIDGEGTSIHLQSHMQQRPVEFIKVPQEIKFSQSTPEDSLEESQETQLQTFPKPSFPYRCLIAMALNNSKTGRLTVSEIYSFLKEHFPFYQTTHNCWKNAVRHSLSLNKYFVKVENKMCGSLRKGSLWAINPDKIEKIDEDLHKWKHRISLNLQFSMTNPGELEKLISNRPESFRWRPMDLQYSTQFALPMDSHQLLLQLDDQSDISLTSLAPAKNPLLHPSPDVIEKSALYLPKQPHQHKPPAETFSGQSNVNSEEKKQEESILHALQDGTFDMDEIRSFISSFPGFYDCFNVDDLNQSSKSSQGFPDWNLKDD